MSLLLFEQLAERRIQQAIKEGQFDDLPGKGKPLQLDDDSMVPESLRMGYRVLKNAGYLPPELEARNQALALCDLIRGIEQQECQTAEQRAELHSSLKRLKDIELRLRVTGMDTHVIQRYLNHRHRG